MRCPFCGVDNDRVTDSRTNQDGYAIRRRRQCLDCKRRFTTHERIEQADVKVVKKDGVRDPFDSDKLRQGLAKACWKRPVSDDQIANIVSEIEREVFTNFDAEVDSSLLGEMIMERLRHIDQVAFVRFASVYREFQDVRDFVDELQPMLKEAREPPS